MYVKIPINGISYKFYKAHYSFNDVEVYFFYTRKCHLHFADNVHLQRASVLKYVVKPSTTVDLFVFRSSSSILANSALRVLIILGFSVRTLSALSACAS